MDKLKAIFNLFRAGAAVANPGKWKTGQVTGTLVATLLMALAYVAKVFGYELPVDTATANTIGAGIVAGVNVVLTIITSKHIGIPGLQPAGEPDAEPMPSPQPAREDAPEPVPVASAGGSVPRVDDATRERAAAWLRQQEIEQYGRAGA